MLHIEQIFTFLNVLYKNIPYRKGFSLFNWYFQPSTSTVYDRFVSCLCQVGYKKTIYHLSMFIVYVGIMRFESCSLGSKCLRLRLLGLFKICFLT